MHQGYNSSEYWNQRLIENFNLTGVGLLQAGSAYNQWLYKLRELAVNRAIRKYHIDLQGYHVLDIGCGTGYWIKYWKKKGALSVSGIDIAEVSIKNLRQKYPDVVFINEDVSNPQLTLANSYDLISAFDVIYHIVDDEKWSAALHNVSRYLNSNGWFFFTDLFPHWEEYRIMHQYSRLLNCYENVFRHLEMEIVDRIPICWLSAYPQDSNGRKRDLLMAIWRVNNISLYYSKRVGLSSLYGYLLGGMLYLADAALTKIFPESPSLELMICKKK